MSDQLKSILLSKPALVLIALGFAAGLLFLANVTFNHLMKVDTVGTAMKPVETYIRLKLSNAESVEFIRWHDQEKQKDGSTIVRVKYRVYSMPPKTKLGGDQPAEEVSFRHDKVFQVDKKGSVSKESNYKKPR
jgi:hypothetical protein